MTNDSPIRPCTPEHVAPDTWVIRQLAGEGMGPTATYVNSSVITGQEPVIVDTGCAITSELWLDTVFGIVAPQDVKWVYLSHDDADHVGSLRQVLDACSNATLVTTAFMVERMGADFGMSLPMDRMRWVNDGESFQAGDRELVAVRPPSYDSPTTRGLFDTKSGVFWASDSMGTPVPHEVDDVSELDAGFFREGFLAQQRMLSPWLEYCDPARYGRLVDSVRKLGASIVTSAHGPALRGAQVDAAFRMLEDLPYLPAVELPGQADLDGILAMLAAAAPIAPAA
jgi:flavorubredoxin